MLCYAHTAATMLPPQFYCATCKTRYKTIGQFEFHFQRKIACHRHRLQQQAQAVPEVQPTKQPTKADAPKRRQQQEQQPQPQPQPQRQENETLDFKLFQLTQRSEMSQITTMHVLDFLAQARKEGLDKLTIETFPQFQKYRERLLYNTDDGWRSEQVSVSSADPGLGEMRDAVITCTFRYVDMMHFLATEFANEKYRGNFKLRPEANVEQVGSRKRK